MLENVDHAELRHALMYKAIDLWLGTGARDWSTELRTMLAKEHDQAVAARVPQTAGQDTTIRRFRSHSTPERTATLRLATSPFSTATGELHVAYLAGEAALAHEHYDVFRGHDAKPKNLNRMVVTFLPDGTGGMRGLRAFGITFLRVPTPPGATLRLLALEARRWDAGRSNKPRGLARCALASPRVLFPASSV